MRIPHETDLSPYYLPNIGVPAEGVTEELKATDQMEWVRRMNSIHARIEEMLFDELIHDRGTALQANRHEPLPVPVATMDQMEVLMRKILKLPLWLAALPIIALLLVFQLISSLIVGLTSSVTNLLATVFLIGSVAEWIANAPSDLLFQTVGLGIFFAVAPHMTSWMLDRVTSLVLVLWDFLQV